MLGIVQGRLSYAGRKLQNFPKNPYDEFKLASKIGYNFIEFFGERKKNKKNPIYSNLGVKKYLEVSKKNNVKIYSFCDNYIINNSLADKKTLSEVLNTIKKLIKLKIKKFILPLYGKSRINSKNKVKIYKSLSRISVICKKNKIDMLLESNMSPKEFSLLKKNIKSKNCYFLFDTGNRILLKRDFVKDICEFGNDIKYVHLKDKNINNKNVIFGRGIVDFNLTFEALKKIGYRGPFAIESQRGENIEFQATKNLNFFRELIAKYIKKNI